MEILSLGKAIKRRRIELDISQESLCTGICDRATLSRLENGKQAISYQKAKALLEKLDLPVETSYFLMDGADMELLELTNEAVRRNVRFERAEGAEKAAVRREALEKLEELEVRIPPEDKLTRQLILRSRVLLGTREGRWPLEKSVPMLLEALRLTAPDFDPEELGRGPYTDAEIKLINQIAQEYIFAGKYKEAAGLLDQLLRYARKNLRNTPPVRARIPLICHNYAIALVQLRRYEDALEIAEIGREICVISISCQHLPGLLAILAECRHYLGNDEESERLFQQAYHIYKAIENRSDLACLIEDAKKCLGIDLE